MKKNDNIISDLIDVYILLDLLLDLEFNLYVFKMTGIIPVSLLNSLIKYGDTKI